MRGAREDGSTRPFVSPAAGTEAEVGGLLAGTRYEHLNYHVNSFNDFPSALVVCWELLLVNNYGVFMEAGQACVSPATSNSYFGAYYFVLVFLLLLCTPKKFSFKKVHLS